MNHPLTVAMNIYAYGFRTVGVAATSLSDPEQVEICRHVLMLEQKDDQRSPHILRPEAFRRGLGATSLRFKRRLHPGSG